jgi:probable F420-dependent oxidoreductase
VVFPQARIGHDHGAIRALAEGTEELGFSHVLAYDHVLGVDPGMRPDWSGPYEADDPFHEPLTLFAYCAGVAPALGFATAVMILPQRQTALVGKQATEVDMLAGGGLRLGVGIGWNRPEYDALGVPWERRGERLDEQVKLLRELWAAPAIDFEGRHHRLAGIGINPIPAAGAIPIWFGGSSERTLRRAAEVGDGFFPQRPMSLSPSEDGWPARLEQIRTWRRAAGRADDLGVEPRIHLDEGDPERWRAAAEEWISLGATHLSVSTIELPSGDANAHLAQLAEAREVLGDLMS